MEKIFILFVLMLPQNSFKETQLRNVRVKTAYTEKEEAVKGYFAAKKLKYENFSLFIRAFKKEQKLEVWIRETGKETYTLLHTYDFCAVSGTLGPKRKEGDYQIPEGIYSINHFNPLSNFYLSLGINYPNASDRILSDPKTPGGSIYIHGNCVTIGCIPLTDDKIKELYVLAVEAKNGGQDKIPVHIFPARLSAAELNSLKLTYPTKTISFWENLKLVYDDFERSKALRPVRVKSSGEYAI
jgi:murein L,D-transpeptidase YafK